jgi:malonyl-CoA/methylmalonyl-CoA synthetase
MADQNFNLYAQFSNVFETRADDVLLITESEKKYSYADVDKESARLANFLTASGVQAGDRVSVQVAKSPAALCLYLACLRAGFAFHPLNTGYQSAELAYFFGNAEPAAVICDSGTLNTIAPLVKELNIPHLFTLDADGSGTLIDQSRQSNDAYILVSRASDDIAALLYSSGTTGQPKGIVLTHNNLYENARTLVGAWGFTEDDVLLHALPIFHVHGLFVALGCVLLSGASMRWLATFNTDKVVEYLPECTSMMGVPTYYTRLLTAENFTRESAAQIRLFISGSAPLLEETFYEFEKRCGHRILERYGMSETNMNTSNPLKGERKPGTVGPPLPGVEVRITDDAGSVLETGEIGNLQVRGGNVFREYWKMPEKTVEDFSDDGFFNTGDKGVIDVDGYVSIVGRSKDMIISGGLNIYPIEIEGVLNDLADVKESAVIGVPHADFGEGVVAVIVCTVGASLEEDQVIRETKEKIASFKVPKRVVFIEELPRNTMGKVQKNLLRESYKDLLQ